MLKRDVTEQLKSLLSYQEDCLKESERAAAIAGRVFISDNDKTFKKDIEALEIAIKAVDAYDYDEREKIIVEVMATKAAEGDAYYFDLETGERLVIREGKIEGIYNPEEKPSKWEKAFKKLVRETHCTNCPCRIVCTDKTRTVIPHKVCEENIFEYLLG